MSGAATGTVAGPNAQAPSAATAVVLTASVALPAGGVFETASGPTDGIAVPVGTVGSPITGGTFTVAYTQGAANGEEAGIVVGWNGIRWGTIMGPGDPFVDPVFTGIPLGVGTGVYEVPFTVPKGISRVKYLGQEKGVPATPGTHTVEASFS